jgi:hypothetical protein
MHALSGEEVRLMQLTTIERLFDDRLPVASMPTVGQGVLATTAQAQRTD